MNKTDTGASKRHTEARRIREYELLITQGCRLVGVLPNGKVVLERQQQKTAKGIRISWVSGS